MSFKSASSFSNISAVQRHLARHQKILRIILSVSPEQIQPHIKDCVINQNKLLIYVSSAVWASQLRFFHTQIKEAVNQQSQEKIEQIRIRILSPEPYRPEKKSEKIIPSTENIDLLHDNATAITEGKLKNALLKLSNTLQQHKQ
ncbi:MAG: DUF721 domain-containing protein [Methyloprofundus sp.]|nr:DUF721 domain-containing protein [Methyloprofundus sp.]